ncbi:MAG TPA: tetratricopeptide repeat protein [Pyrinomonadaceae bacterium]|jgi:tetratricopeptide (TPR) repeat protein
MKKRLMLAVLLLTFSCTITLAQVSGSGAQEAIKRGNERYARAEYESAIKEYRRVAPGTTEAYAQSLYNIGVCYYELRRTEDAIVMYRSAVEARGGRYPKALYALGVALEISGRLADAKEAYRQAIEESDGKYTEARLAVAHYRLGLLAGRVGDYEKAAVLFREALARSKDRFPAVHNNLGVMLALSGRIAEAEREFEIALQQSTDRFEDAAYNLKLCRSLLTKETQTAYASLKVSDSTFVLTR